MSGAIQDKRKWKSCMRTASKKKLPIPRKRAAKVNPWSSRARQAEEELSSFFSLSLDLLCVAGMDGYFKRMNPAWESILGWTVEELQARPFLDFVHADDRGATESEMRTLAKGAATIAFENRYLAKDGHYPVVTMECQARAGAATDLRVGL